MCHLFVAVKLYNLNKRVILPKHAAKLHKK